MKKNIIIILCAALVVIILAVVFIAKPIKTATNDLKVSDEKDVIVDEEEIEDNDDEITEEDNSNFRTLKIAYPENSNKTISLTFNSDKFHIDEYFFETTEQMLTFTNTENGRDYLVFIDENGKTKEEFYSALVEKQKNKDGVENFKSTDLEHFELGGADFYKFTISWTKDYEYQEKETGALVSGTSKNEETAVFAELESGVFLIYDGEYDEDILKNLFIKIK